MLIADDEPNVLKSITRILRNDGIVCHTAQNGQEGEDIPLPAWIVSVIDVFDALTHERPYKRAWSESDAFDEIFRLSGKAFDPFVVFAFFTAMGRSTISKKEV